MKYNEEVTVTLPAIYENEKITSELSATTTTFGNEKINSDFISKDKDLGVFLGIIGVSLILLLAFVIYIYRRVKRYSFISHLNNIKINVMLK
jgi:hypothetical protein